MTTNLSIAIGKGYYNQDEVVPMGFSAESCATSHSKMSKYNRFDNPNTNSHSAGTDPSGIPEKDIQEFDRVFMGDRSGMNPGGGLYIPEGRGTIGPDSSDLYGQNAEKLNSSTDQQGHYNHATIDAASVTLSGQVIGIALGVLANMVGDWSDPDTGNTPENDYDAPGDRCQGNPNADCDDYEDPGCHCDVDPITGEPICCECSDDINVQPNSQCQYPENIEGGGDGGGGGSDNSGLGGNPETDSVAGEGMSR